MSIAPLHALCSSLAEIEAIGNRGRLEVFCDLVGLRAVPLALRGVDVIDSVLWYTGFRIIYAVYEGGMFTAEELRQAEIFVCLDEAECARLAQTIADVRLEPGEWLFREGAPPRSMWC